MQSTGHHDYIDWGGIYSSVGWNPDFKITAWPVRCTECDTRYKKHKRTTRAIRAVFYHPNRMELFEHTWCLVPRTKYKHIKLITLEHTTQHLQIANAHGAVKQPSVGLLHEFAQLSLAELKEKFRRKRKLVFWSNQVLYGRWFAEVTWTVHYADGSKSKPTQWVPTNKELLDAVSVSIHPHLHVVACAMYLDKEELTEWWDYGTHVRATDRWMVCKDYLTKYVNKQQLPGRHQGTFGSLKKR